MSMLNVEGDKNTSLSARKAAAPAHLSENFTILVQVYSCNLPRTETMYMINPLVTANPTVCYVL